MKIRLEPKTFTLSFGKEYKRFADVLVSSLDDFMSNVDMENISTYLTLNDIRSLARILYELKTAPLTGYTPRCELKLYEIFTLEKIVRDHANKENDQNARTLAAYLKDMYDKMKDVRWD